MYMTCGRASSRQCSSTDWRQLDNDNSTAGRHSAPLTRGSLYPLALAGVDLASWIAGSELSDEEIT